MTTAAALLGRVSGSLDAFTGSEAYRYSMRVSIALVIMYALAISWGWGKPYWGGMAVLFCALATTGSSVKACVDRVLGTGLSLLASLLLLSLFPHDRWLFLLTMCAMIGAATYLQVGSPRYSNIWFNVGFNMPIMALLGAEFGFVGPSSFEFAVLRFQETVLGALVFGVVALFLWRTRADLGFLQTVRDIASSHRELVQLYARRAAGTSDEGRVKELRTRLSGELATLRSSLYSAAYDNDEIGAICTSWERYIDRAAALNNALERWRESSGEIEKLELRRYINGLDEFVRGVSRHLDEAGALLADKMTPEAPRLPEPRLDIEAARELTHLQRAAVLSCHDQLLNIGRQVAALYATASAIRNRKPITDGSGDRRPFLQMPVLEPDRLAAVLRQMVTLFAAGLVVIFIPPVPSWVFLMAVANAFSMLCAPTPQIPLTTPVKPAVYGLLVSGVLYMLVMPQLDSFLQYGTMLFAACFIMTYITYDLRNPLPRIASTVMLICIITGDSPPTYSFETWVGWVVALFVWLSIAMVTWRFPISFLPDAQVRWQLRRLLRSAEVLLASVTSEPGAAPGPWLRWRRRCHLHELTTLPARIGSWIGLLPADAQGSSGRGAYGKLVESLQIFSDRLAELLTFQESWSRRHPDQDMNSRLVPLRVLGEELRSDLRDMLIQLRDNPSGVDVAACRARFERMHTALEAGFGGAIEGDSGDNVDGVESSVSRDALLDLYRLLGSYRGALEALEEVLESTQAVDWDSLSSARF